MSVQSQDIRKEKISKVRHDPKTIADVLRKLLMNSKSSIKQRAIARDFNVKQSLIPRWRDKLLQNIEKVFEGEPSKSEFISRAAFNDACSEYEKLIGNLRKEICSISKKMIGERRKFTAILEKNKKNIWKAAEFLLFSRTSRITNSHVLKEFLSHPIMDWRLKLSRFEKLSYKGRAYFNSFDEDLDDVVKEKRDELIEQYDGGDPDEDEELSEDIDDLYDEYYQFRRDGRIYKEKRGRGEFMRYSISLAASMLEMTPKDFKKAAGYFQIEPTYKERSNNSSVQYYTSDDLAKISCWKDDVFRDMYTLPQRIDVAYDDIRAFFMWIKRNKTSPDIAIYGKKTLKFLDKHKKIQGKKLVFTEEMEDELSRLARIYSNRKKYLKNKKEGKNNVIDDRYYNDAYPFSSMLSQSPRFDVL